jgi:hypothetical protein
VAAAGWEGSRGAPFPSRRSPPIESLQIETVLTNPKCAAGQKVGRIAYGMEIEPPYVDVAIKRWQTKTKLEATLEGDGRNFEEISEARAKSGGGTGDPPSSPTEGWRPRSITVRRKVTPKVGSRTRLAQGAPGSEGRRGSDIARSRRQKCQR